MDIEHVERAPAAADREESSATATATATAAAAGTATAAAVATAAIALAACGGGGSESPSGGDPGTGGGTPPPAVQPTAVEASRFLAQASMGANKAQIARVQSVGYSAWIDEQFALPQSSGRWEALVAGGYDAAINKNSETGFDPAAWRKLLASPDTLRQRVTLALCEIMVTSIDSLVGGGWKAFAAANYLDLLEANAFGNYRTLMQQVSTNTAMGM